MVSLTINLVLLTCFETFEDWTKSNDQGLSTAVAEEAEKSWGGSSLSQ